MSKCIFITGTGTDVGKTYVSGLITKKLRENNINCGYYKPVLSGGIGDGDSLIPGDCENVCKIAGIKSDPKTLVSYIYKAEVSPHLASIMEKNPVTMELIRSDFKRIKSEFDFVTVEGAGGIVCPLRLDTEKIMIADVIKKLELDIIIVMKSELGNINNGFLTVEYAKNMGIKICGIIMNEYDSKNFIHEDNKIQIEKLTGVEVIATVTKNAKNIEISLEKLSSYYKEI